MIYYNEFTKRYIERWQLNSLFSLRTMGHVYFGNSDWVYSAVTFEMKITCRLHNCLNVIDVVIWQLYYYYLHNEMIYFARQQSEKKWHTAKWYVKREKTGEERAYDPEMHNVKTSPKAERWKPTGKPRLDFLFYSFLYAIFILTASGLPFSQMLMLPQLFFCCYPF